MTVELAALPADTAAARLEPLRPLPIREVQRAMAEYQEGLTALLDEGDWQSFIGKDGKEEQFVKKSGWRKVATWFGLDLLVGEITEVRDEHDEIRRARVVGRVVAPSGRKAEAVGACSITERRFSKPDHDIPATACTRAFNRATSDLVGMGAVSAEEIGGDVGLLLPAWAQPASGLQGAQFVDQLSALFGGEEALRITQAIGDRYDGVPVVVIEFLRGLAPRIIARPEEPVEPTTTTEES